MAYIQFVSAVCCAICAEFHGMDRRVLEMALRSLEVSGKAVLMEDGVKFLGVTA